MNKLKMTYMRSARNTGLALLALLLIGTFADLPISRLLYPGRESSIGQFFAAFGELPCFALMIGCGVLLLTIRTRLRKVLQLPALIGSALLILASLVLAVHESVDNVPAMPTVVALIVAFFVSALTAAGLVFLTRACPAKTVVRFVCTVLFVTVLTMLLVNIIKIPWGRVRMRLIVLTGNESYYTPWWKAGTALKKRLVAEGVSSDEFRSFPSGHTACAACAMLFVLFPTLSKRLRGRERMCLGIGLFWTGVVAFTRINMGAHFLSDVSFSALLTLCLTALGVYLFYFNKRVFNWVWDLLYDKQEQDAQNAESPAAHANRKSEGT